MSGDFNATHLELHNMCMAKMDVLMQPSREWRLNVVESRRGCAQVKRSAKGSKKACVTGIEYTFIH